MTAFDNYLDQTERALDADLYYPALALGLALPDICASCELPSSRQTNQLTYQDWCLIYMKQSLGVHELYALRCAFLHNGTTEFTERQSTRGRTGEVQLWWQGPRPRGMGQIRTVMDDGDDRLGCITHDAALLCRWLVMGARSWQAKRQSDPFVAKNLANLSGVREYSRPARQ
jgi:hypothetical protein